MPSQFTTEITGLNETIKALSDAPANVAKGAYGKALTAATVPVIKALDPRIPIALIAGGIAHRIGALKSALTFEIAVDANGRGGLARIGFGKQGFVARMVEYGHRMVGHKPKSVDWKRFREKQMGEFEKPVPPYPFMAPATISASEQAVEAFAAATKEALDEGMPGLRRSA
jgi:hypothetical protein